MSYNNHPLLIEKDHPVSGLTEWKSPSNIAIVKYWGKHGRQLPRNPSLSFTLSEAYSVVEMAYERKDKEDDKPVKTFLFEQKPQPAFQKKIDKFLVNLTSELPFISQLSFNIKSHNSFPHSSGIASSASSMSAIALCLCHIERILFGTLGNEADFLKKASYIARLGSGSASRSVFPGISVWGAHRDFQESADEYAIPYNSDVHKSFLSFHDDILIVSKEEKAVSSTAGHALMENNPYSAARYQQAGERMSSLKKILAAGDVSAFGEIAESEALTLHALMMCSQPSYMLMKEGTLHIINKIRDFRKTEGVPVYFTLDAGPNVHILYPDEVKDRAAEFIHSELKPFCENDRIITDHVGQGPFKLK